MSIVILENKAFFGEYLKILSAAPNQDHSNKADVEALDGGVCGCIGNDLFSLHRSFVETKPVRLRQDKPSTSAIHQTAREKLNLF